VFAKRGELDRADSEGCKENPYRTGEAKGKISARGDCGTHERLYKRREALEEGKVHQVRVKLSRGRLCGQRSQKGLSRVSVRGISTGSSYSYRSSEEGGTLWTHFWPSNRSVRGWPGWGGERKIERNSRSEL